MGARLLRLFVIVLLFAIPLGCGDDGAAPAVDSGPTVDVWAHDDANHDDAQLADAGRSAACLTQDVELQAALDGARTSPNAMLVVRNPTCGTTVYVSGENATADLTSLWRVGSVTKTFMAATIISMASEGTLELDDPLAKWVPDVPDTAGITLRMLLNHTSGIFNFTADPAFSQSPMKDWTPAEMVALATAHAPYFAPGEGWEYSNTNYILLGMVAEAAGGAAASALIRQHALTPAGLTDTFLASDEAVRGSLARGFDRVGNDVTALYSMVSPWTAGAMTASGKDLCNWLYALLGTDAVLSAAERAMMLDGVDIGGGATYGLGMQTLPASITAGAGVAHGHGGDIHGFHTQAFYFPAKQTAICSVVNQDGADPNDVTLAALRALF